MRPLQIRHKLVLWFTGLVSVLLLAFSSYVYVSTARFRHRSFTARLARKAEVTQQIVALDDSIAGSVLGSLPEQVEQVYAPDNRLLYQSEAPDFTADPAFRARVRRRGQLAFQYPSPRPDRPKEGVALAYRRPGGDGQYVVIVTAYDLEGYAQQQTLFDSFLYGNVAAVILAGVFGLFLATRALAPVNFLLRQLRLPHARTLRFRLRPVTIGDEVGVLAAAFNELLSRQEELVESQRAFIAHASHELRTPLTTIKGWLETSLTYDSDVAGLRKGIRQAITELDKLTALANGLLHLAHLDGATRLTDVPIELVDLLLDVVASIQHQRPGQRLDLTVSGEVEAQAQAPRVPGNAQLLRTALGNLVDNAAKYSAGQPVALGLTMAAPGMISLQIEDQGPGIDPAELDHIFQPLMRGRHVGSIPGFGIGLTLAQRIIHLHDGQLHLLTRPGGGTIAEVRLPLILPE